MRQLRIVNLFILMMVFLGCQPELISNQKPVCYIISPVDSEKFVQGDVINVEVIAYDIDSNLNHLALFSDGVELLTNDQFPEGFGHSNSNYQIPSILSWNTMGLSAGYHTLSARIYDIKCYFEDEKELFFFERATQEKVMDFDGNSYNNVKIGDQIWFSENLRATHLNDGTPIPYLSTNEEQTLAYNWYNNDSINNKNYGAYYTVFVAESGKLCPNGWHVPTFEDWEQLADFISLDKGPFQRENNTWEGIGYYLRSESGWDFDKNGINSYGFKALPINYKENIFSQTSIWMGFSGTDPLTKTFAIIYAWEDNLHVGHTPSLNGIYPVRCIKDR